MQTNNAYCIGVHYGGYSWSPITKITIAGATCIIGCESNTMPVLFDKMEEAESMMQYLEKYADSIKSYTLMAHLYKKES